MMAEPQALTVSAPRAAAAPVGFTRTDALLALMVTIWGVNFIVVKAALPAFNSPLTFNAVRFSLASLAVFALARARGAPRPPSVLLPRVVAMALLGNTVYQLLFIEGVAHTRAGNAALIMAAIPVQTAVMSHLLGHERLRGRDALGLVLSTAGIATIVLGSGTVGFSGTVAGDLMMLASAILWSAYTIGTKPLADALGATAATAWTMGLGAIPLVLICLPTALEQNWRAVAPVAWGGVVFSALGALVVAYLIWSRGIQRLGPARTALYSNFTPVVAVLAAWPLLGETPTLWQALGATGIFGGIWLTRT